MTTHMIGQTEGTRTCLLLLRKLTIVHSRAVLLESPAWQGAADIVMIAMLVLYPHSTAEHPLNKLLAYGHIGIPTREPVPQRQAALAEPTIVGLAEARDI